MNSTTFSIANLLSFLRLFLVPALVWLALQGHAEWFLAVLVVSLVSDIFDGYLARKLNQVSDFGAKLIFGQPYSLSKRPICYQLRYPSLFHWYSP